MSDKRIKFSAIPGLTGYVGLNNKSKDVIQFENFYGFNDESELDRSFRITIVEWKKIVKFIEEELKELGG